MLQVGTAPPLQARSTGNNQQSTINDQTINIATGEVKTGELALAGRPMAAVPT
jgi:hypothetical protein